MSQVFVGNLDSQVSEKDLKDEFQVYGSIRSVWIARDLRFGFVEFDDLKDALDAIHGLDGKNGWHVDLARSSWGGRGRGRGRGGRGRGGHSRGGSSGDGRCYECGEPGHFAWECWLRRGRGCSGSRRRRSPSPQYRRSPSNGRRSYSPRDRRSRQHSSNSPRHGRSIRRSSPSHRRASPYANGDRRSRSRSRS